MKLILVALTLMAGLALTATPALAGGGGGGGGRFWICDPPFTVPCLIPDWPAYDSSWSELPIILPGVFGPDPRDNEARWMVRTVILHPEGTVSVCRSTGYRDRKYDPPKFRSERTVCGPK